MRSIDSIIVHCSDSYYGDAELIRRWHRDRGWRDIGYHYVILNGYPNEISWRNKIVFLEDDGKTESGRSIDQPGAHVKGHNESSIGICLIGKRQFTSRQIESLIDTIDELKVLFGDVEIRGHHELDKKKTCPNLDMIWLRSLV